MLPISGRRMTHAVYFFVVAGILLALGERTDKINQCGNIKKDIIIAMDSSASIRSSDWEHMKIFVQDIVRNFPVSKEDVQFCIYQFSTVPRSDGLMCFGRYEKNELIRQIGKMVQMGLGTKTGRALAFAQQRFRGRGNRKGVDDMLWVITDGMTEDLPQLMAVSTEMRQNNVQIMALVLYPNNGLIYQMTKMTGDREKVLLASSICSLNSDLCCRIITKIYEQSCVTSALATKATQNHASCCVMDLN